MTGSGLSWTSDLRPLHEEPQATTGKTLPAAHLKGQRQLGAGGERVGEARKPPETRISIFGLADSDVDRIVAMTPGEQST